MFNRQLLLYFYIFMFSVMVFFTCCDDIKTPPISVHRRESAIGNGYVYQFINTTESYLHDVEGLIGVESNADIAVKFFIMMIPPHGIAEVGWGELLNNWEPPVDSYIIKIKCKGYERSMGPLYWN